MLLKKIMAIGEIRYFSAITGRLVKLEIGEPCTLQRLPDYAFGFISPAPTAVERHNEGTPIIRFKDSKHQKYARNYTVPQHRRKFQRKTA